MRYHELALQRWLYAKFQVREGYPVPVVFATPMDAFSLFNKLWKDDKNPFRFLFDLKDESGTPLYEPYPANVRYPLISVMRKTVRYRPYQNFSIHRFRHVNWPTVSDTGTTAINGKNQTGIDLLKCDLANVTTSQMPQAFDYRFQIDHMCLRPDTQAFFVEKLIKQFWRTGGVLQTWLNVDYPGWGTQQVRLYVDGDIDHHAPEEADFQDKNVEFRTSFTIVIEGFSVDLDYKILPALWNIVSSSATPVELDNIFFPPIFIDLRAGGVNEVLDSRPDIPSAGTCAQDHFNFGAPMVDFVYLGDPSVPEGVLPGNTTFKPQFGFGIPSAAQAGTPVVVKT